VVALSAPGVAVWGGEDSVDLFVVEVDDLGPARGLGGDGEHPGDQLGVVGVAEGGIADPDIAAGFRRVGFRPGSVGERGILDVSPVWGWPLRASIWLPGTDRRTLDRVGARRVPQVGLGGASGEGR